MVHVKVFRSGRPHALIRAIDVSGALSSPGVVCALTAGDVPGANCFGLVAADQPVLCDNVVRFSGDAIAIVAAETEAHARAALSKIKVVFEDLPPVLEPRMALAEETTRIWPDGNLCHDLQLGFGDAGDGLRGSAHVAKLSYVTGRQEHAFLETEAGVAFYEDGLLCVVCGGQNPYADRTQIASILDLPEEEILVSHPPMGGAFGGKEDLNVQAHLALVVHKTGRPARMVYDRSESIAYSVKRHRFEVDVEVGCDASGNLTAFRANILADTGAYRTLGPSVVTLAAEHCSGPYRFRASEINAKVVHTNNGNASAFRGFGNPQVILGIEQAMDVLAAKLGLDAIDFRLRNLLSPGDRAGAGHIVKTEVTLPSLAAKARESALLIPSSEEGDVVRSTGFAFVWQGFGLGAGVECGSTVAIRRDADGIFTLDCSAPDLGQGNLTAFLQIAADVLQCEPSEIRLKNGSTRDANSWSTNASRSVSVTGSAVLKAAMDLKEKVASGANGAIEAVAHYSLDFKERLTTGAPHIDYAYAIQLVRLALEKTTGIVTIEAAETYVDPGVVINPDGVTGQIEGGFAQGLGFALLEDLVMEEGRVRNDRLSSYIIPTIRDVPKTLRTVVVGTPSSSNPLGTRGVAEIGLTPVAVAVANALASVTGERFDAFPITPEAVLSALERQLP